MCVHLWVCVTLSWHHVVKGSVSSFLFERDPRKTMFWNSVVWLDISQCIFKNALTPVQSNTTSCEWVKAGNNRDCYGDSILWKWNVMIFKDHFSLLKSFNDSEILFPLMWEDVVCVISTMLILLKQHLLLLKCLLTLKLWFQKPWTGTDFRMC